MGTGDNYAYDDTARGAKEQPLPRIRERGEHYFDSYNGDLWGCAIYSWNGYLIYVKNCIEAFMAKGRHFPLPFDTDLDLPPGSTGT